MSENILFESSLIKGTYCYNDFVLTFSRNNSKERHRESTNFYVELSKS